ncbi:MAG: Protein SufA [Legionellaceae bacterium]
MQAITLTETALKHVKKMMTKRGSGVGLKIGITKTGCSGFSYALTIIDEAKPEDYCYLQSDDITKIYVEPQAYPFIQGLQVDYENSGLNGTLKYNNPNAENLCGCGESFSLSS